MNTSSRRVRHLSAGLLAAGSLVVLSACSTGNVLDLEVGQCISSAPTGDQVSSVPLVDCAEPHQGEIFALPQLPDGEFPGEQAVSDQAEQLCTGPEFQSYVGVPYQQSEIYYNTLLPTAETWADGDREIVCILVQQDGSDSTGSLRGANR